MRVEYKYWIVIIGVSGLLSACGSTSPKDSVFAQANVSTSVDDVSTGISDIAQMLSRIEKQSLLSQDVKTRNADLLKLADSYIQQRNCNAANIIIKHIQTSLTSSYDLAFANILKSECALETLSSIPSLVTKRNIIQLIQKWLDQANVADTLIKPVLGKTETNLVLRKKIAQGYLYAQKNEFALAIDALLSIENNSYFLTTQNHRNALWSWFAKANKDKRYRLSREFPILNDYLSLLDVIEDNNINDAVRQTNLRQWLATNASSVIAQNLPDQIETFLAITSVEKQSIAVLLPLSGRLSGQGEAIKQGVLSAYYANLSGNTSESQGLTSIEFIDTGSFPTIAASISQQQLAEFDSIIGPLLKSHVDQLNNLALTDKRQLLLNQPSTQTVNPFNLQASFALAPEQEAEQLVALMRRKKVQNPVLIRDNSNMTERMLNAFIIEWQRTSVRENAPTLQQIRYTDNKNMRIGITDSLDVLQSQKRIQQLSNLTTDTLQSVTRNRRDIDAFVVFSRPDDIELINPIIESSISLFSDEELPVFATSYSYNHKQNRNSLRDLRNLVFTDMPWLLPQGRQQSLSVQVDQLLNQPPSGYLRLFAFGYDSLAIVNNLAQLSTFPHMSIGGLSGTLSIDHENRLIRNLDSIAISDFTLGK